MASIFDTPEFLDQRDEWYAKLKAEGFRDIEILDDRTRQPGPMLHGVSPGDLQRSLYKPETEEYYRSARKWSWKVKRGMRRQVWNYHADGLAEKTIFSILSGRYEGLTFYRVKEIIRNERERMQSAWNWQAEKDFEEQ